MYDRIKACVCQLDSISILLLYNITSLIETTILKYFKSCPLKSRYYILLYPQFIWTTFKKCSKTLYIKAISRTLKSCPLKSRYINIYYTPNFNGQLFIPTILMYNFLIFIKI